MPASFDPYHLLLGVRPEDQPPDHYQLLGIERLELNADVISNAAERQCDQLKRHSGGEFGSVIAILESAVHAACDCLLDRDRHRQYAAKLQGFQTNPSDPAAQATLRTFGHEFDQTWQSAQQLEFDPQHHWLGIPRHQRPASNFRLLGIATGEQNPTVIQNASERQIAYVRKFTIGNHADEANELLRHLGRVRAALISDGQIPEPAEATPDRLERADGPLRSDTPILVAQPVALTGFEDTVLTTDVRSVERASYQPVPRLVSRRKRKTSKSAAMLTTLAWLVPFVAPTAAIVGYVIWSGDGGERIFAALDAFKSPAKPDIETPEPLTRQMSIPRVVERQQQSAPDATRRSRLPDQEHAKPERSERSVPEKDPREPIIPRHSNSEMSADSVIPNRPNPGVPPTIDPISLEHPLFATSRIWSTESGRSFEATVVNLVRNQVTMKSSKNGREAVLSTEDFIDEDEVTLRVAYFDQQDDLQFQNIHELVRLMPSLPEYSAETLNQAYVDYPDSPYAGLWESVVISESENKYSVARSMLQKIVERLDQQRAIDPERHAMTLASALNNLAVCMIMNHKTDAAAALLARSLEVMPESSPIVLHNSRYLLRLGTEKTNPLKLNSTTRRKLTETLKNHPPNDASMRQSWYYALDVNLPRSVIESQAGANKYLSQNLGPGSVRSTLAVRHSHCVACQGLGKTVCRNCNKGIVSVKKRVQIGVNQFNGEPIMSTKVFREKCPKCNGRGTFDCSYCDEGRLR